MKFAKELERDAVPEWRIKYLNYKAGKKYVKAIGRAVNRSNSTPRSNGGLAPSYFSHRTIRGNQAPNHESPTPQPPSGGRAQALAIPQLKPIHQGKADEEEALATQGSKLQYGSFVATPLHEASPLAREDSKGDFELPEPAMGPTDAAGSSRPAHGARQKLIKAAMHRSSTLSAIPTSSPLDGGGPHTISAGPSGRRLNGDGPSQLRRLFSHSNALGRRDSATHDLGMQGFDLVAEREAEFYRFMHSELDKVDTFYKMKEEQAARRLVILREQLHEMRNRRMQELSEERQRDRSHSAGGEDDDNAPERPNGWIQPIKSKLFRPGPNSVAFSSMPRTPLLAGRQQGDATRDYIRRPDEEEVSYRSAKRKLKLALQEFYRGLELLKSFALLNRTAFRKINKKFDKAVNARPPYRFMTDKVNQAWFVQSDVLEGHIKAVEDLYARYFERGNQKLAAGKLRSLAKSHRDESGSSFLNGFLIGTGLVFAVQGTIYGVQLLYDDDAGLRSSTGYLLQIYGGYFLMLLLFSLFCVNCFIWDRFKINYPFIFEFDQRHQLDWRRVAEFPSFFLLVFGICMWVNFSRYGSDRFYLWYPVVLIAFTVFIILLPLPFFAPRSRKWLAYSHWRLLLAGLYPVEFRDFFLGDMYCSLTYAMANAELFFCLYSNEWENPQQCNSNHSRVLGFLTALPPILRFLQCIRRYKDTGNIFPHLVNCGKYTMSIMAAVSLSLYRIERNDGNFALFLTFSLINGIYCSLWDVFMDFSLLQAHSRHVGLRDIIAFKTRWPYYTIMVVDPIGRFAWILYAIFAHDRQHSTIVSFLAGLLEVLRRGAWAIFRVENEHCANVSQYKASRDVPLPYSVEPLLDRASVESSPIIPTEEVRRVRDAERQDNEAGVPEEERGAPQRESGATAGSSTAVEDSPATLRRRREAPMPRSFSRILADAHTQDFEKRRKPGGKAAATGAAHGVPSDDDDDDDDDDDVDEEESDEAQMHMETMEAEELRRRGTGDS